MSCPNNHMIASQTMSSIWLYRRHVTEQSCAVFLVCFISGKRSSHNNRPNYLFIRGLDRRKSHRGTGQLNSEMFCRNGALLTVILGSSLSELLFVIIMIYHVLKYVIYLLMALLKVMSLKFIPTHMTRDSPYIYKVRCTLFCGQ